MKNIIIGTAVVAIIGLFTLQYAGAGPGRGPGFGFGTNCPNWDDGQGPCAEVTVDQEEVDAFRKETAELRSQLIDKRAEYQKLTLTKEYDRKKANALTDEIYTIQDQLREKAQKAGINRGYGRRGPGCGDGWGRGGNWKGRGYGPGCGNCYR